MRAPGRKVGGAHAARDAIDDAEAAGGFGVRTAFHGRTRPADEGVEVPAWPADVAETTALVWKPPVHARYDFGRNQSHMLIYSTPTRPGECRLFFAVYKQKKDTPRALKALFGVLASPLFRFYGHWGNSAVLAGDNPFIARQSQRVRAAEAQGQSYRSLFHMPTSMDAAVARLRSWFEACPVAWAPGAVPARVPTRYESIERKGGGGGEGRGGGGRGGGGRGATARADPVPVPPLVSHTDLCVHCTRAMRRFVLLRAIAAAVAIVGAVYLVGGAGAGRAARPAAAAAVALASALAAAAHAAVARFVFVDYVHADKH